MFRETTALSPDEIARLNKEGVIVPRELLERLATEDPNGPWKTMIDLIDLRFEQGFKGLVMMDNEQFYVLWEHDEPEQTKEG